MLFPEIKTSAGRISLTTPCAEQYLELMAFTAEQSARLAGFQEHGAKRARLMAEEVFSHVCAEAAKSSQVGECELSLEPVEDGLSICFSTTHMAYDPQSQPAFSLRAALEEGDASGLGLYLVKAYASQAKLIREGALRRLCLVLPQREQAGARPWGRLVPSLRSWLKLYPIQHEGRLKHRLDDGRTGKSYLVRPLAHQVLSLIDGQASFGRIMAQTLKVMPEKGRHQVEDLFQVLVERGLVSLRELPRPQAEITEEVRVTPDITRGMAAYQSQTNGEPPEGDSGVEV